MSTRGFISFAADGQLKTCYNHYDSYPDGLGLTILEWARSVADWPAIRRQILGLVVVDPETVPTAAQAAILGGHSRDWYSLLSDTMGKPQAILDRGHLLDGSHFPAESLYAEWGYVIDLDGDGLLEVYRGFQKRPHYQGRFAAMEPVAYSVVGIYYPCALVIRWGLGELPDPADFCELIKTALGEEED